MGSRLQRRLVLAARLALVGVRRRHRLGSCRRRTLVSLAERGRRHDHTAARRRCVRPVARLGLARFRATAAGCSDAAPVACSLPRTRLDAFVLFEFVSADDPKAREILTRKRAGLHGDYDRFAFERELSSRFSIIRRQELLSGTRTLYFLRPLS
jgi:hypothetical protein